MQLGNSIKNIGNLWLVIQIVFLGRLFFCIVDLTSIFFNFFVLVFCCSWHINSSAEIKEECIRCLDYIVDQVISLLVRNIRNDLEMQANNSKLTIWTTLLGDFNEHGLRQHAPIKIRNKRPDPMLFHMRY